MQLCFHDDGNNGYFAWCKRSTTRHKMAMRLYHRRSSATRDKLQVPNGFCSNSLKLQGLSVYGHRDSLGGISRPRSMSMFPGSNFSLDVPPRSRSSSFSGSFKAAESLQQQHELTASEEEHIFRCYTRVMYVLLGSLAAVVMGLIVYGVHSFVNFR